MELRQEAIRILEEGMRIGGLSPERTGASRPHYLMRDPENHPSY
jgi:hypothetical protein